MADHCRVMTPACPGLFEIICAIGQTPFLDDLLFWCRGNFNLLVNLFEINCVYAYCIKVYPV